MLEGSATLAEIERYWSVDDVMRANAVLDFRAAQEAGAIPEVKRGSP